MIYCIGDSHIGVLSNNKGGLCDNCKLESYDDYNIYSMYSKLAYNIGRENHPSHQQVISFIDSNIKEEDVLIFLFGEIDCRCHIVKQAKKQNINIRESSKKCVESYSNLLNKTIRIKKRICIGPHLYCIPNTDIKTVFYGTIQERYKATIYFNLFLQKYCINNNIKFFTMFSKILREKNREDFFEIFMHLNHKCTPFFRNKIQEILHE